MGVAAIEALRLHSLERHPLRDDVEAPGPVRDVSIYLDVDGVINAVSPSPVSWGWEGEGRVERINGFPIRWAPQLVDALNDLASRPHVHMHWLTTWEGDAPRDLCPVIGLDGGDWPVLRNDPAYEPTALSWWKLAALQAHLPDDRRAIWIDDDIAFDRTAQTWLDETPRVTAFSPRTWLGLTRAQMNLVLAAAGETEASHG